MISATGQFFGSSVSLRSTRRWIVAMYWCVLVPLIASGSAAVLHSEWLSRMGPLFFFLVTLLIGSLLQSLILWTKPYMEKPQ